MPAGSSGVTASKAGTSVQNARRPEVKAALEARSITVWLLRQIVAEEAAARGTS